MADYSRRNFSMPYTKLNVTGEESDNLDGNISLPDAHQHSSQVLIARNKLAEFEPQVTRQCPTSGYYVSEHHSYNNVSGSTGFLDAQSQSTMPSYSYTLAAANISNPVDLPRQIPHAHLLSQPTISFDNSTVNQIQNPPAPSAPTAANVPTLPDIHPVLPYASSFTCAWENCTMRIERNNSSDEVLGASVEEHLKTHESTFKRATDGKWHCKWVACSKTYADKKGLCRHLESCMNEVHPLGLKYKCWHCGADLTRKDSRNRRIDICWHM